MPDTYIDIMIQSLKKKEQVLNQIVLVNKRQKEILESIDSTPDEFDATFEEKDALIEQMDQLDSGFEKLFERVKELIESDKESYAEQIKEMQKRIRTVTELSVEIQAQEARNKDLMTKKFASIRQQAKSLRTGSQVVNAYQQSMGGTAGGVNPQFMDNKK